MAVPAVAAPTHLDLEREPQCEVGPAAPPHTDRAAAPLSNPRLVCLKCGGLLDRIPDMDGVRCDTCERLWDMMELHRARLQGDLKKHGVGEEDLSDATGEP